MVEELGPGERALIDEVVRFARVGGDDLQLVLIQSAADLGRVLRKPVRLLAIAPCPLGDLGVLARKRDDAIDIERGEGDDENRDQPHQRVDRALVIERTCREV